MSKEFDKILKRSGTGQPQRFLEALDPATFDLHDFTTEDWLLFAYNFAKSVNYYAISNDETASDNWQCFFKEFNPEDQDINSRTHKEYKKLKEAIDSTITAYKEEQNLTPHLTLFVCFLQLLEFSKKRFNKLTKRHLDFYYKEVLQVDKLEAVSDQVHILFELARKTSEEKIAKSTELNADVDKNGNQRIYKTNDEIVVNKTEIGALKSVYNGKRHTDENHKGANPYELKASQASNTLDGLEEPLKEEAPYWYPFGYTSADENYTELENAEVGFAIASPMLKLQEGLRQVILTIDFKQETQADTSLADYTPEVLKEIISIYASGEEDWVGPIQLKTTLNVQPKEGETSTESITAKLTQKQLKLVFQLTQEEDAIVNYNEEFLLKKYNTSFPVARFVINTGTSKGYNLYKGLSKKVVEKITVRVEVDDIRTIQAENDTGILKTTKPFYPFTTQPLLKSNFSINYEEAFAKKWESFGVQFKWKDAPEDFQEWYDAYLEGLKLATKKIDYVTIAGNQASPRIVKSDGHFTAEKSILHKEIWQELDSTQTLFTEIIDPETEEGTGTFECLINFMNTKNYEADASGPIRLSLEKTFLHKMYPRLYAMSLMTRGNTQKVPNEPYTPIAEDISVSYKAEEAILVKSQSLPINADNPLADQNSAKSFQTKRIQLFHEHPFGLAEEHNYLKISRYEKGIQSAYDEDAFDSYLVPKYCQGGDLFIGLKNAEAEQTVSLLIQVLEGSENPLVDSFEANEEVHWSVLCNNGWKDLKENIVTNNTENFLSSGIIQISLPKESNQDNTLLPENMIWLRAKIHKTYDAVCKVMDIHTQAVLAKFENNDNELSHLESGLPAKTIKKLMTRVPQVKSLSQPYTSFDGVPEESDEHFYRRISERLRHKNRAITLWDYEHLILQKYPEIYKVKCLNHTSEKSFSAAGHVTIVTIPDTTNKNVFDNFEPRVSQGLLAKVERYINTLNTMHVDAKVINPNYEQVSVKLEVEFYEGYDKSYYSKKIQEDIIKFLSPWAYDDTKEIEFGITLHKSLLIDYLEKLEYVDYLQNVEISKEDGKSKNSLSPSDPKSILVSAKEHNIETVLSNCSGPQTEPDKVCQV